MTNYKLTDAIASTDTETKMWKSRFSVAKAAYGEGNFKECKSLLYRALEQGQKLKEHEFAVNTCLVGLAAVDIAENKLDEAQKHLEKAIHALSVSTEPALRELHGVALRFNAHVMFLKGETNPAREEIRKAAEVLEALGPE